MHVFRSSRRIGARAARRLSRLRRKRQAYRRSWRLPMNAYFVPLTEVGLADEHRVNHIPSFWKTLPRILPPNEVGPDDVFLDLGSGMGRTIIVAGVKYRFRRIIGVEISAELNQIAQENVARSTPRLRCSQIELINTDVLNYRIPDDVTVVYLYNPFRGPVFQHVVDELERSIDRNPREIRIIYLTPREEGRLLASGRVTLVRSARAVRGDRADNTIIRLYRMRPSEGPRPRR